MIYFVDFNATEFGSMHSKGPVYFCGIKCWVSDVPDIANDAVSCGREEDTVGIFWTEDPGVGCWGSKQGGPHIPM